MILQWKSFKIDLASMSEYLANNISHYDGIIANNEHFEIITLQELSELEIDKIMIYYNSLNEQDEQAKLNIPISRESALLKCKNAMIHKDYDDLSLIEKKILLKIDLTEEEIQTIVNWFSE